MSSFFKVKPVIGYKAGYPVKGFFKKSIVKFTHLKLFSILVIGLIFFISVPGCGEQVVKTDGVPEPDFDVVNDTDPTDNETTDIEVTDGTVPDETAGDSDIPQNDYEPGDFDQIDGGAVPECMSDEECAEGYYCDMTSYTCVEKLSGDAVPECLTDEDCDEGYSCDLTTYTCVEKLSGDPIPDQEVSDSEPDDEIIVPDETEVPDEELGGIAPPEIRK
ncbi:MAG TPA: dickkopf-related protein [bacterium]|nr:dickkopf-related protein [bacterium]